VNLRLKFSAVFYFTDVLHSVTWTDNFMRVGNANLLNILSQKNLGNVFYSRFFNVFFIFRTFLTFFIISPTFLTSAINFIL
jgi:hypothetical protein